MKIIWENVDMDILVCYRKNSGFWKKGKQKKHWKGKREKRKNEKQKDGKVG